MKKTTEERLADIESNITRLTKMQGYLFEVLLILHTTSALFGRSEQSITEAKRSLESAHRRGDRFLVLMFGAIAVVGVAISAMSLYLTTHSPATMVVSIVSFILFFVLFFFGVLEFRRVNRKFQLAEQTLTEAEEVVDVVKEKVAASDDDLARVLAEWKELVHDDSASEPKSED